MPPPTITRTPIIDDDGSLTVGTVFENAWKQEFYGQIDAALGGTYSGAVDQSFGFRYLALSNQDYGEIAIPDLKSYEVIYLYNHTIPITIHSVSTNGAIRTGQIIVFVGNVNIPAVRFAHLSTVQGNAALRFTNIATSAPTPIAGGGYAFYLYNGATWILVQHDQGEWLTGLYAASNFSAAGGGTWVVDPADVVTRYQIRGKTLHAQFVLQQTTITGAPGGLYMARHAFGGFYHAQVGYHTRIGYHNNPVDVFVAVADGELLIIQQMNFQPLTAGTNTWTYQGQTHVPII